MQQGPQQGSAHAHLNQRLPVSRLLHPQREQGPVNKQFCFSPNHQTLTKRLTPNSFKLVKEVIIDFKSSLKEIPLNQSSHTTILFFLTKMTDVFMNSQNVLAAQPQLAEEEGGRSGLCVQWPCCRGPACPCPAPGPGSCRQGADFPPSRRDRAAPVEEVSTSTARYRWKSSLGHSCSGKV